MSNNPGNHVNDRLWLVIRSLKDRGYVIEKHDILKLGWMKFKIKEFRTEHDFFSADEEEPEFHRDFSEVKEVDPCPPEDAD